MISAAAVSGFSWFYRHSNTRTALAGMLFSPWTMSSPPDFMVPSGFPPFCSQCSSASAYVCSISFSPLVLTSGLCNPIGAVAQGYYDAFGATTREDKQDKPQEDRYFHESSLLLFIGFSFQTGACRTGSIILVAVAMASRSRLCKRYSYHLDGFFRKEKRRPVYWGDKQAFRGKGKYKCRERLGYLSIIATRRNARIQT